MQQRRTAPQRLAGQSVAASLRSGPAIEVGADRLEQFGVGIQPSRRGIEIVGDRVVNRFGFE